MFNNNEKNLRRPKKLEKIRFFFFFVFPVNTPDRHE